MRDVEDGEHAVRMSVAAFFKRMVRGEDKGGDLRGMMNSGWGFEEGRGVGRRWKVVEICGSLGMVRIWGSEAVCSRDVG